MNLNDKNDNESDEDVSDSNANENHKDVIAAENAKNAKLIREGGGVGGGKMTTSSTTTTTTKSTAPNLTTRMCHRIVKELSEQTQGDKLNQIKASRRRHSRSANIAFDW